MILEAAKCPNCDANIELDPKKTFFVCNYCGANISVKNAITAYQEEQKKEYRLKIAEECLEKEITEDAVKIYKEITKEFPNDYRGWWGIIRCNPISANHLEPMDNVYKKAIAFAPEKDRTEIENHYQKRIDVIGKHKFLRSTPEQIKKLQKNSEELNNDIYAYDEEIKNVDKQIANLTNVRIPESEKTIKTFKISLLMFIVFAIIALIYTIVAGDEYTIMLATIFSVLLFIGAYTSYLSIKEEKQVLKKLESELSQENEKKNTAKINLTEVQTTIKKEQQKIEELEAEMKRIQAELKQC